MQRWRRPKEKGGTDGFIPRWWHQKIIAAAGERGIDLPPSAFVDATALPAAA